jgi:hypothetical protein
MSQKLSRDRFAGWVSSLSVDIPFFSIEFLNTFKGPLQANDFTFALQPYILFMRAAVQHERSKAIRDVLIIFLTSQIIDHDRHFIFI